MDFIELYYKQAWGCYPFETDDNYIKSQKIIDYLKDNNIDDKNILKLIEEAKKEDYIDNNILQDWLWENSYIKKDIFYYHNILHLSSKAPKWTPENGEEVEKYYMEMKISFTIDDLTDYYYKHIDNHIELQDRKRDSASLKYLLTKYNNITIVESLDFVLALIDYASKNKSYINSIIDLTNNEKNVYDLLNSNVQEAKVIGADKIVWRS